MNGEKEIRSVWEEEGKREGGRQRNKECYER